MNIFEQASVMKLRFQSARGLLTVEDLWDLPLTSRDSMNLDSIAKTVNSALKANSEESFVKTTRNLAQARSELELDVVKHIISVKIADQEANKARADRKAEKEKLLAALANKQDQALNSLSEEDIKKRIKEIDNI